MAPLGQGLPRDNAAVEIIRYEPRFKSRVLELLRHRWPHGVTLRAAYLEWKYERNPYQETSLIHLTLCAGMCGAPWEVGDRPAGYTPDEPLGASRG